MTPYILPATIFGQFALHFLGIAAACLLATLAFFAYTLRRRTIGRIAIVWLTTTAIVSLFVLAAAIFGAAVMISDIMLTELQSEFNAPDPTRYPRVDHNATEGNVEDIQ